MSIYIQDDCEEARRMGRSRELGEGSQVLRQVRRHVRGLGELELHDGGLGVSLPPARVDLCAGRKPVKRGV